MVVLGGEGGINMITTFLLCWIGMKLNAPAWYYILAGIGFFVRTFDAYRYATRKRREAAQNRER